MNRRSRTPVDGADSPDFDDASNSDHESSHSHRDKRRRVGAGVSQLDSASQSMSDDENGLYGASQSPERPIFPSSFLRSPQSTSTRQNGARSRTGPRSHQPGAIVRVKLIDFVTYTNAEFKPGPSLNMIIGPNGTGKSTLVCAICLGLGYKTQHLGRAKDIAEFVKHGRKLAIIEIELAAHPDHHHKNPVITTKIVRETNKAEYSIDGRKVSSKNLQELMNDFSIQIDNLCQFLPQDRVVEFAALSPVDLLTQTQKAAAPGQMTAWHEQLKILRREQKTREQKHVDLQTDVKSLENRQRLQAPDVERLRQRAELQNRLNALERLRPFPEYNLLKAQYNESKEQKRQARQNLAQLSDQIEPNLRAVKTKEEYVASIDGVKQSRSRLVERTHEHIISIQRNHERKTDEIRDKEKELQSEKEQVKQHVQDRPRLKGIVQRLEHALQNAPPEYDTTAVNDKLQDFARRIRECDDQATDLTDSMRSQVEQARQRSTMLRDLKDQRARLQTQAGQQEQKLKQANAEVARAWDWMKQNRDRFEGEIYGPAILECTVKNESHAGAVEAAIGGPELFAVTVTDQTDFRMLYKQLYEVMKLENVHIRTSTTPLTHFSAPISSDAMKSLGLECWLLDLIDGPEPVLAMLCDNRNLQAHGFTTQSISQAQYDALLRTNLGAWSTPKERYSVARRREYGDQGSSVRSVELRPARFFKDAPVEYQMDSETRRKEQELEDEIEQLKRDLDEKKQAVNNLKDLHSTLIRERDEVQAEKNARQTELAQFRALPAKLEQAQQKLADLNTKIRGATSKQEELMNSAFRLAVEKGQIAVDLANAVDNVQNLHNNLLEAEIMSIEAHSDLEQCQARHERELGLLRELEDKVKRITEETKQIQTRAKEMEQICKRLGKDLSDIEVTVFDEIEHWKPDQLGIEIQAVTASLELTAGNGHERIIQEFEERALQLEKKQEQLNKLGERLGELEQEIGEIRQLWEPRLDALVEQISAAFAENFAQIQCAGEVGVHKDEEFEQWAIQIKVKFRESEQLSILDSHRQSGGERAVSTIFYLMALQSLARVPFRVVDEINQGMDPRNERMVHSRMVDIACAEDSASQYFLITPKLLNGLKYHPHMKVHCIASGEYMPEDHRQLDFDVLAQKALAVRHAQMTASTA